MWKIRRWAFRDAFNGFIATAKNQVNFRYQLLIGLIVILAGTILRIGPVEWLFIIFAIGFVLAAETMNTAIEHLTDLIQPNYHPLAGKVKDASAASVLISSITAALIGMIIFGRELLTLIQYRF